MHFLENNHPQDFLYLDISFSVNLRTMLSKNISETFISVLDVISRGVWRWENEFHTYLTRETLPAEE